MNNFQKIEKLVNEWSIPTDELYTSISQKSFENMCHVIKDVLSEEKYNLSGLELLIDEDKDLEEWMFDITPIELLGEKLYYNPIKMEFRHVKDPSETITFSPKECDKKMRIVSIEMMRPILNVVYVDLFNTLPFDSVDEFSDDFFKELEHYIDLKNIVEKGRECVEKFRRDEVQITDESMKRVIEYSKSHIINSLRMEYPRVVKCDINGSELYGWVFYIHYDFHNGKKLVSYMLLENGEIYNIKFEKKTPTDYLFTSLGNPWEFLAIMPFQDLMRYALLMRASSVFARTLH